jgi:hypothetical protein
MSTQPDSSHVQHLIPEPPERRSVGILLGLGIFVVPFIFVWFLLRTGHSTLSRVLGFGWFAFCLIVAVVPTSDTNTKQAGAPAAPTASGEAAPATPTQEITKVTAVELARAYEANEVAAQQAYGGRKLEVTGTVSGVTLDFLERPTLQLEGSNAFVGPQAQFDKEQGQKLGSISKGDVVTFQCDEVTEVISAPMLAGCSF